MRERERQRKKTVRTPDAETGSRRKTEKDGKTHRVSPKD